MGTILNKLWASKGTTLIIIWAVVFAWIYNLDYTRKSVTHPAPTAGKTLEEIISGTADNSPDPAWDTGFKSAIEAAQ